MTSAKKAGREAEQRERRRLAELQRRLATEPTADSTAELPLTLPEPPKEAHK